ncbi:hypothetical protein K6025_01745 [Ehrlichia sp. JZT12]
MGEGARHRYKSHGNNTLEDRNYKWQMSGIPFLDYYQGIQRLESWQLVCVAEVGNWILLLFLIA